MQACLQILFSAGEVIAVVALVHEDERVRANSRLQASASAARLAGAAMAGLLFAVAPIADGLFVDAASFVASAVTLACVRSSFNLTPPTGLSGQSAKATVRDLFIETKAGVAYVWNHRLLRVLALQILVVNLFGSVATSELALLAVRRLGADNSMVGYLQAASGAGVVALSSVAGTLARRLRLGTMILAALVLYGSGIAALGLVTSYPAGVAAWAVVGGGMVLYNVSTVSLRQRLVPPELMGRVWNVGVTIAWCAIPVGSLAGGAVIAATGRVGSVYVVVGTAIVLTGLGVNRLGFRREDGLAGVARHVAVEAIAAPNDPETVRPSARMAKLHRRPVPVERTEGC